MSEQLTLTQITERIMVEKAMEDRWPARLIFTHTLDGYKGLVAELRNVCDVVVSIADERFTTSDDILPNFKKLAAFFHAQDGKTILVTDIGEYLRICISKEITNDGGIKGIWEHVGAVTSKTKIIMPMFSCDALFDRIVPKINERQAGNSWRLAEQMSNTEVSLSVYSLDFGKSLVTDVIGLRAWLSSWSDLWTQKPSCSIVTKLIKYSEEQHGDVSLKVVDDLFSYATELVSDGDRLKKEWFDDWATITSKLNKGERFGEFINREFGITDFDFLILSPRWIAISEIERQYIWVWYRLYPNESYIGYVVTRSEKSADIPQNVRDKIFEVSNPSTAWIKERSVILAALPFIKTEGTYLTRLRKLPIERQIEFMNFTSTEDQAYALELIGKMLTNGTDVADALALFGDSFSLANDYFAEVINDTDLRSYFQWYKSNKLKNCTADSDNPYIDIDAYDGRHKILAKYENDETYFLWVDGLGLEWSALLCRLIENRDVPASVTLKVGKALLPTETEFNKVWESYSVQHHKIDRFDKLAHNGVPDNKNYYTCVVAQFAIIAEIADEAIRLISANNNVVIVGDHGSSRLAALAFHADEGITPEKNWDVKSHGRFCIIPHELSFEEIPAGFELISRQINRKTIYALVSKTYAHLKQSGNVPFETHGGATPEEALVSVILLSRHIPLPKSKVDPFKKRGFSANEMGI